jgi:hypothetical protein
MRSTPTLSMEDVGSHNDLYRHCQGRTWAGDDEPEGGGGGLCCSSGFDYSPGGGGGGSSSSSTKRARPRHSETVM